MTVSLDDIRAAADRHHETVLDRTMRICAVPSPTHAERKRAEFVAGLFREMGYEPEMDEVANVYARRGSKGGKAVLVLAHTDTVFPAGTPIEVRRDERFLYGPGIGDNSSNVAGMLTALQILDELKVETESDIIFCADVGEEGLGNLRGARAAVERHREELGAVVVLDGRIGRVTISGVGSLRWRVTVNGPGGHSFGAFGTPSAIHGLGRIIAAIADLDVPTSPKTTYNAGIIEGGTSVNTIAASASMILDMRSADAGELHTLADQVRAIIDREPGKGLTTEIELLGERPAGSQSPDHPLIQIAVEACRWVGYEPELQSSSTDLNIPVSFGIPGVCVGTSIGEGTHTVNEHIHIEPFKDGVAHVTRLLIDAAAWVATGKGVYE